MLRESTTRLADNELHAGRTVTLLIHGIHCGMSALLVHMANAWDRDTPGASTRALSTVRAGVSQIRCPPAARPSGCAGAEEQLVWGRTHVLSSQTAVVVHSVPLDTAPRARRPRRCLAALPPEVHLHGIASPTARPCMVCLCEAHKLCHRGCALPRFLPFAGSVAHVTWTQA